MRVLDKLAAGLLALLLAWGELLDAAGVIGVVRDHRAVGLHFAFRIPVTGIGVTRSFLASERKLIATTTLT